MQDEDKTAKQNKNISDLIKQLLADHLGTEPEDISEEDSFTDNLNMTVTDLSDFFEIIANEGIDISKIDLPNIETVGDLIESLSSEESF